MTASGRARVWSAAALLVAAASLLLVASTWRTFGHTWDEPEHLAAGLERLDLGRYDFDIQHPPLARMMIALGPWLDGARPVPPPDDVARGRVPADRDWKWRYTAVAENWHVDELQAVSQGLNGTGEGTRILYAAPDYERLLSLARLGALPFLAMLLGATWLWARRVLAPPGAALAASCAATVPPVLGHAGLAALDVPAAATVALALYALHRWFDAPTWRRTLLLGATAGVAVGTKLSALPFLAVGTFALACVDARVRSGGAPRVVTSTKARTGVAFDGTGGALRGAGIARRRDLLRGPGGVAGLLAAAAVALAILTFAYGPRLVYLTDAAHRTNALLDTWFGASGPWHDAAYAFAARVPVPAIVPLLGGGLDALVAHNESHNAMYLLGATSSEGWWYFYPVALAAKTSIPMLLLGVAGLALLAHRGWRERERWSLAVPLTIVALLAFCCAFVRINIGVRHVLIAYPFLAIGMAHALVRAWSARSRLPRVLAAVALAWHVAPVVHAYPDYLPWFNEAVREPRQVLVDSDLDWGQDVKRLAIRLRELRVPAVRIAYAGTADLSREGLPPFRELRPNERATGWIAVTELARLASRWGGGPDGYAWLDTYGVRERIGRTIDLYYVPPASETH